MRIIDYINEGGPIMYLLVLLNVVGFTIIFWKVFSLYSLKNEIDQWANKILENFQNKIKGTNLDESVKHEVLKSEITNSLSAFETGLNTVKIIASISPLLGLLGTVIGILSAFEVIAQRGLSDPSLFAGGISMALITTVGGLIVAIPHLIGHNYLVSALDKVESALEDKVVTKAF